jgi:hypothetical protein
VGIATTLFKGALHDTSSVLSCLVTLNVAGALEYLDFGVKSVISIVIMLGMSLS